MRRGPGCGCVGVLLVIAAFVGASLWLDVRAPVGTGRVRARHEEVTISNDGHWTRAWRLEVDFPPSTSGIRPNVTVDSALFARARVGDGIRLHYVPCCPFITRPVGRSTAEWMLQFARYALPMLRWALWLGAGIAGTIATSRIGRRAVLAFGGVWVAGTAVVDAWRPRLVEPTRAPAVAMARVEQVKEVEWLLRPGRRSWGWHLTQPYDVVVLSFVPAPGADAVVAVDAVDAGSIASLDGPAPRRVRFDSARPREARLADGTRTFDVRNRTDGVLVVALTMLFVIGAGALLARKPDVAPRA